MLSYSGQSCSGSVAEWLSPAQVVFDLASSGNISYHLQQTAMQGKMTFLTFMHVGKQDDNAHN